MNKLKYAFIFWAAAILSCHAQTADSNTIYNKDFKWTIVIPKDFVSVSTEEWSKVQNKGTNALEKTIGQEIINQAKTIFVFQNDQFNYFEANYQPFDEATDGNYLESCKAINDIVFETFKSQMPQAKIERSSSTEKIDGFVFQTFKVKIELPNKMVMTLLMFSRLFEKKELTVNIMYIDTSKGEKMLASWRNSKFKK
ncbi:hypothetical protein D3C87_297340 [compost metagenome]